MARRIGRKEAKAKKFEETIADEVAKIPPESVRALATEYLRTHEGDGYTGNWDVDIDMSMDYLCGYIDTDPRGVPSRKYLSAGEKDEVEARDAICRVLRSNRALPGEIRNALAQLFDPDPLFHKWRRRRIEIKKHKWGDAQEAHHFLAHQVWKEGRSTPDRPLQEIWEEVASRYGRSLETIQSAWEENYHWAGFWERTYDEDA